MAQHRANPIKETIEHVAGLPDHVVIYKIPASSYWYVRASFNGKRVPHSLKTEVHGTAMAEAKRWYLNMLVKQQTGQPLTVGSEFKKVAEALLADEKERVRTGDRKQSLVDDFEYIYKKDLLRFFKSVPLRNIDKAKISEYLTDIGQRDLSSRTKKNHLMHLTKVLAKAEDLKLIDRLPSFPKVPLNQTPRAWLSQEQLARLLGEISKAIKDKVIVRHVPITDHLRDITLFQRYNFLRPSDLRILKHKDITLVKRPKKPRYLRIMAKGKVRPAQVVTMQAAVPVYERLKGDPESYVLFPEFSRDHAMSIAAKQFAYCLGKAGLKQDENGAERTMYSLRHSAIMGQLIANKWSMATIARNCRTSVAMIDKFYGSHLQAEMQVDSMHQNAPVPEMSEEPPEELQQAVSDDLPEEDLLDEELETAEA